MDFFDLHCDTAYELYKRNLPFQNSSLSVTDKNNFDNWVQTFAVWIKDDTENPFKLYQSIIKDIKQKLKTAPENLTPLFAVEGGSVIEDKTDRLEVLKKDGIRFLTLTWNGENAIAGGCKTDKGLTDFGARVIKELNRLRIAADLSHLNRNSFYSAIEYAEYPMATHSNCFEICHHPRNLTNEQISLIAERQGVIGLTFYPEFLGENVFDKLYENILLLCDRGYENNIAIGSDFDGGKMNESLDNISKIPTFHGFLEKKGLKPKLLNKIFYQNAYNFIAKLSERVYNN